MQTFLPYKSFEKSARVLDNKRLGKQRVECTQILRALLVQDAKGWVNHPAVKMWRGHEGALYRYTGAVCNEWVRRGFKNEATQETLLILWHHHMNHLILHDNNPSWMGSRKFHAAHRSNLLRKLPTHYGQFGWKEPDDLPYVWPV